MIRLDRTTRKIEAVLAGAVATSQPNCAVSFYDVPMQSKEDYSDYRGATTLIDTNGATPVTICAAPSTNGTIRNVDYINIHNKDTASVTVTVQIDDGGTDYILAKVTLAAGETLLHEREGGWQVL